MTLAISKIFLLSSNFKRDFEKNASQSQLAVTATAKYIKIFCHVGIFKYLYLKLPHFEKRGEGVCFENLTLGKSKRWL